MKKVSTLLRRRLPKDFFLIVLLCVLPPHALSHAYPSNLKNDRAGVGGGGVGGVDAQIYDSERFHEVTGTERPILSCPEKMPFPPLHWQKVGDVTPSFLLLFSQFWVLT